MKKQLDASSYTTSRGTTHEDRLPTAEWHFMRRVSCVIGKVGRDRRDQIPDESAVEVDTLPLDLRADARPVRQSDGVTQGDADIFEDIHRGRVDSFNLRPVHHLTERNTACQTGQHIVLGGGAQRAAGRPAAGTGAGFAFLQGHLASPSDLTIVSPEEQDATCRIAIYPCKKPTRAILRPGPKP